MVCKEVLVVPKPSAEECPNRIANDFIARWAAPLAIQSDQGASFESRVFKPSQLRQGGSPSW